MVAENIERLRFNITQVCKQCNRDPREITVVAVSKTYPSTYIREAHRVGIVDFGENYVQELRDKQQQLTDLPLRWHFVGHLQSNKVKYIVGSLFLIHSVDSVELAKEIDRRAQKCCKVQDILIEVHTTHENTKFGVKPEKAVSLIKDVGLLQNVHVCGLMTMGPLAEDPEASRPSFRLLRELQLEIQKLGLENVSMNHLSMGMTNDYPIAIQEGATLLRIGTAIFGVRQQPHT
ncbi:MAG: YggS family pyridoxal phosphate-dependent enzyme [Bacteroidetes bacterium]|nr:YggS family pyridoxal phosphate-dependent enzyme [Bacteroidota bacterium]